MKITKKQLKNIIKEELTLVKEIGSGGWDRSSFRAGRIKKGDGWFEEIVLKSSKSGRMTPTDIMEEWGALEAMIGTILKDESWSESEGRNDAHKLSVTARGGRVEIAAVLNYSGAHNSPEGLWV